MQLHDDPPPRLWRFIAHPDSASAFELDRRPAVYGWTADRGGHVRRGDLVLLYGSHRMQRYVAIARVCADPVENDRAQRLMKNRSWWTYLQVQPLRHSVPRQEVEALAEAKRDRSGLKTPSGARSNRVADGIASSALDLLVAGDAKARQRLAAWRSGGGSWPEDLDTEELRYSELGEAEPAEPGREAKLTRAVAARLVRSGRFRYVDPVDRLDTRRLPGHPAARSLEYPIRDEYGAGRIDVLLVEESARRPTLLVIEVKLRASLARGRDPVAQVTRYVAALSSLHGDDWDLTALVVAEFLPPDVQAKARQHGVEYRTAKSNGQLDRRYP